MKFSTIVTFALHPDFPSSAGGIEWLHQNPSMAWVYMLRCRGGAIYVGSTLNLDGRLWQHQEGLGGDFTSRRRPVQLIWCVEYDSIEEAFHLERKLHGWSKEKKELLAAGDFDRLAGWSSRSRRNRTK